MYVRMHIGFSVDVRSCLLVYIKLAIVLVDSLCVCLLLLLFWQSRLPPPP